MGISFGQIYPERYPLRYISEHCMMLPMGEAMQVINFGWPKIIYFFSGTLAMTLEETGERFRIGPRETVILYGTQRQRYEAVTPSQATWAHVLLIAFAPPLPAGEVVPGADAALGRYLAETFPANTHLNTRRSSALWDLAVRLRNTASTKRPLHREKGSELARLFTFKVAELAGFHRGVPLPRREQLAEAAVDMALEECSVSRSSLARRLGVSVATLDRACRLRFGMPYASYVEGMKIEQAKSLLLSSSLPVARVGLEAGFRSPSSFSRAFKGQTGVSPVEFQKSFQADHRAWQGPPARPAQYPTGSNVEDRSGVPEPGDALELRGGASFKTRHPALLMALEGSFDAHVGGRTLVLSEESLLLVSEDERVILSSASVDAKALYIEGRSGWGEPFLGWAAASSKRAGALELAGGLPTAGLRELAFHDENQLALHLQLQRRSLLATLWWDAWERAIDEYGGERGGTPTRGDEPNHRLLVSHAQEFIKKHFRREFTLGEVAWAVGVSEEHLARVFRQEVGETVMHYRLGLRLEMARRDLLQGTDSIAAVAEGAGFISVAHFYKAFKARFGCTPAALRNRGSCD